MYNPYDLVSVLINSQELFGRPIEFDSEVIDHAAMTNAFGNIIRPTKVSLTCPDCGQGLILDVALTEPPFHTIGTCYLCNPELADQVDPFMNPIEEGRITEYELDPLLHDPAEHVTNDGSSVLDRMNLEEMGNEEPVKKKTAKKAKKKTVKKKTTKKATNSSKVKKKVTKKTPQPLKFPALPVNKNANLEPAEFVGEEVDFDDNDLIELE